jgi:tetratricopeptide (TPR) repeat protein
MSVLLGMLHDLDQRGETPRLGEGIELPPPAAAPGGTASAGAAPAETASHRVAPLRKGLALAALAITALAAVAYLMLGRLAPASRTAPPIPALAAVPTASAPNATAPATPAPVAPAAIVPAPMPPGAVPGNAGSAAPAQGPARAAAPAPHAVAPAVGGTVHTPQSAQQSAQQSANGAKLASAQSAIPASPSIPADGTLIQRSGSAADRHADLGRALEMAARGRDSEAIHLLQTLLQTVPDDVEVRQALATLLAEGGRRAEATDVLLGGVARAPERFALPAARWQAEMGALRPALATLDQVPERLRDASFHATRAALLQRAGEHGPATGEYQLALADAHPRALWWVGLAASYEQTGHLPEAAQAYRQALRQGLDTVEGRAFARERLSALGIAETPPTATPSSRN